MEELEFSYIAGGSINCYDHYGQWGVFTKTNCIHVLGLYINGGLYPVWGLEESPVWGLEES